MKKSLKRQDYRFYEFSKKEWILTLAAGIGLTLFFAWFFYRSLWAVIPLSPLCYFAVAERKKAGKQKRCLELTRQFKECILSVSASLQAGYAVENAFLESRDDMRNLYGCESMIYQELEGFRRGLVMQIPLEKLLVDFGERSDSEEIMQFADMFSIAKRGGGNLPELIRTSASLIAQKMEARAEIDTLLSGRRMEQMIMRVMPFGIVFYVGSTYHGYFDPLYGSLSGVSVMTICLILYAASVWIGERVFREIWNQMEGRQKKEKLMAMERQGVIGRFAKMGEKGYVLGRRFVTSAAYEEELRRNLEMIYPDEPREELLKKYFGGKIAVSLLISLIGGFFSVCLIIRERAGASDAQDGFLLLFLSLFGAAAVFFMTDKDLRDQVQKKKERLRMGYPELVHRLSLYLVAGLSIRSAFLQIGKGNEMVGYACREMQAGLSELTAYEHFGKRAGVREYVKLSTLLCQNLKKGNRTLLARLEEEAILAQEGRIQSGRRLGEEAETKILIPMVMQLAMIMLMIMIPAFSMMGV